MGMLCLTHLIAHYGQDSDTSGKGAIVEDTRTTWAEVTEQDRVDLINWYNVVEEDLDDDDKQQLAQLFGAGRFKAWDCPECGKRCYEGDPIDWSHFQGVLQLDHASYPGNTAKYNPASLLGLCDSCRGQS